jgi:hypothetical protein
MNQLNSKLNFLGIKMAEIPENPDVVQSLENKENLRITNKEHQSIPAIKLNTHRKWSKRHYFGAYHHSETQQKLKRNLLSEQDLNQLKQTISTFFSHFVQKYKSQKVSRKIKCILTNKWALSAIKLPDSVISLQSMICSSCNEQISPMVLVKYKYPSYKLKQNNQFVGEKEKPLRKKSHVSKCKNKKIQETNILQA